MTIDLSRVPFSPVERFLKGLQMDTRFRALMAEQGMTPPFEGSQVCWRLGDVCIRANVPGDFRIFTVGLNAQGSLIAEEGRDGKPVAWFMVDFTETGRAYLDLGHGVPDPRYIGRLESFLVYETLVEEYTKAKDQAFGKARQAAREAAKAKREAPQPVAAQ